ncbi:MAG TPA: DnaJ domain-containing protein [Hyphomicrobiaceae bacterium]|nr:DnaJ domain-containing protein [Hyphomicrobiaceae bacterium]
MKLDSKYFDMVRIRRPQASAERVLASGLPCCQWKGCEEPGLHRAPMGRGKEGRYYLFCPEHIRQYNASYNYFAGMSDAEIEEFQKDAVTGHRPTWKVGANAWSHGTYRGLSSAELRSFAESRLGRAQSFYAWRARHQRTGAEGGRRRLKPLERKALAALGLDDAAERADIKSRFKELVKRHHPDSNGGDRGSEEKLREIIQAYNYLKQGGLV